MTSLQKKIVAVVLVIALVGAGGIAALSAVGGGSDPQPSQAPSETGEPQTQQPPTQEPEEGATDAPEPALQAFYSQELAWEGCGDNQCARLEVPLDYAEPDGETIQLAVLRVPAGRPGERVGSLVVNPGGPGAPGTSYAARASSSFGTPLRARFDIVGFDPRGTANSAPVDCLSDDRLDAYLAADGEPDDEAEIEQVVGLVEELGAGCAEQSPDVAAHVTTIEAARDMDVLRAALGEADLTYFGASYGTKLGATYAELFPERAGRLVLDGGIDLQLDFREQSLASAAGFEQALRSYAADCVEQGDCPLGDSVEAVLQTFAVVVENVDEEPLPTDGERDLQAGHAFTGIITPLYNEDFWFLLTDAMQAAIRGDGTALLQLADIYASRGEDGFTDNSAEAIFAINCLDDPSFVPPSEVPAQFDEFEEASPTFGRTFAWGLIGCGGQEAESTVDPVEVEAEGAEPIMVIGTTRDPATPYAWSEALADQLDSGFLVTRDGDGHLAYNRDNGCVDDAVEQFLIEGTVPEDGLTC